MSLNKWPINKINTLSHSSLEEENALGVNLFYFAGTDIRVCSQSWRDTEEWFYLFFIQGDEEIKSDIYTLFFHIVQRIPEYLIHLQVGMSGKAPKVIFRLNSWFWLLRNTGRDQEGIINISKYLNTLRLLWFPHPHLVVWAKISISKCAWFMMQAFYVLSSFTSNLHLCWSRIFQ